MIDLRLIDDSKDEGKAFIERYKTDLKNRKEDPSKVDALLDLNKKRKQLIRESESLRAEQKAASQQIGVYKKEKKDASELLAKMGEMSKRVKEIETRADEADEAAKAAALMLPNYCHNSVPVGKDENENRIEREVGAKPNFSFKAKEHFELSEDIDFDRAAKVTGSRFVFMKDKMARLERALIQFMLDYQSEKNGYTEINPPYIINSDSLMGTGQFPKFKEDVFHLSDTDLYLGPTAEVAVTNLFRDEILSEDMIPQRFCAFSPCFRSEAGSYGRDTKGLIRMHQFHKVELLIFAHPEKSYEEHERMTSDAESILQRLELPYRVVTLCTGDIGFGAAKCHDIEAWLPGQEAYREISSCSNCEDFQARRANIRFRPAGGGKPQLLHTLNGSGLPSGRTLVAILENYQQEDGRVKVPEVLRKYMNDLEYID